MKYCFVSRELAGLRGGGIGTYVAEAGKALSAAGHEVWLLTEGPVPDRVEGFARVIAVRAAADRAPFLFGQPHYEHAYAVHETLMRFAQERFDCIEFADYQAEGAIAIREQSLLGAYGDSVLVVTLHSPAYDCFAFGDQLHRAEAHDREVFALEDQMLRDAAFLNSPSVWLRDHLVERLGLEEGRVEILRYPMEPPSVGVAAIAGVSRLEDVEFVYFGRIEPRKGIANLLDAFARMPELRLRLIGGDTPFSPYGGSYREWVARRAPQNVEFVGELPRLELLDVLRSAHVCILPSLFENWPNACIEAMALGRVVIGSVHGGMREMLEPDVSGFHVDGRDVDDIVRVVREGVGGALARLPAIGSAAQSRIAGLADPAVFARRVEELLGSRREQQRAPPRPESSAAKVSVVIPFFRDRDTVHAAVASAMAQTHADLEILIVDDGSPLGDAAEILAGLEALDRRVRVLRKPNGGLSSARNHGIEHAAGEYLLFLDADNSLRPEYASIAACALDRRPDLGFVAPHVRFLDDSTGVTVGTYNPLPFVPDFALVINRFGDAGAFFRRSVFVDHGLRYDELLISFEDWALWIDCDRLGIEGRGLPRTLYDYRMRGDSMMQAAAWPNFRALIGLLVERHLLPDSGDAAQRRHRRALLGLNQTWGRDATELQVVREERGDWPGRYYLVDKLFGLARKIGLGHVFARLGAPLRRASQRSRH